MTDAAEKIKSTQDSQVASHSQDRSGDAHARKWYGRHFFLYRCAMGVT
jgi:hypothetical protein